QCRNRSQELTGFPFDLPEGRAPEASGILLGCPDEVKPMLVSSFAGGAHVPAISRCGTRGGRRRGRSDPPLLWQAGFRGNQGGRFAGHGRGPRGRTRDPRGDIETLPATRLLRRGV